MEQIKESLYMAISTLLDNLVRSLLSLLGIVIGIASVITILSFAYGTRRAILERVESMGVNVYDIYPQYDEKTMRYGSFEQEDVNRLQKLAFVVTAFPKYNISKEIRSRYAATRTRIEGVHESYLKAKNLHIWQGRNFSPIEMEDRSRVTLISAGAAKILFPDTDPVGQMIYLEGYPWNVIGVYGDTVRRPRLFSQSDSRVEILAPLNTLARAVQKLDMDQLQVHVQPEYKGNATQEMTAVLERDDPKRRGLFYVLGQKEMMQKSLDIQKTMTWVGAMIVGVSLLVGGIGMMNVMLTSVAERTREIGLRRAIGARKKDILLQFLIESCVLSALGGLLGLLTGTALARFLAFIFRDKITLTPQIEPSFLVTSVGAGIIMGVLFGLYPAIKASRLSPADALRIS